MEYEQSERIQMQQNMAKFDDKKQIIFQKTEQLAKLIDKRNDFFEHADNVADVLQAAECAPD